MALALAAGIGLSIASTVMATPSDERYDALMDALPGANCGGCGYSGCSGYAEALAEGAAENGLCTPGGWEASQKCAGILGLEVAGNIRKTALIHCLGIYDNTSDRITYHGVKSCAAAMQLFGGTPNCAFGCVGLGDCKDVCVNDAIETCNGAAHILPGRCTGCGMCAKVCPKGIISVQESGKAAVVCSSHIRGNEKRKVCKAGCIGCKRCEKICLEDAITVTDFCASVDPLKCTSCGQCTDICPAGIVMIIRD